MWRGFYYTFIEKKSLAFICVKCIGVYAEPNLSMTSYTTKYCSMDHADSSGQLSCATALHVQPRASLQTQRFYILTQKKVSLPLQNDAKGCCTRFPLKIRGDPYRRVRETFIWCGSCWEQRLRGGRTATTGDVRLLRVLRTKSLFGQTERVVRQDLSLMQEKKNILSG